MNPRLVKEWSPLRLPTYVAVGAALMPLLVKVSSSALSHEVAWFLVSSAVFAFTLSIPLLAATSFGIEFHHRTFGLLLAQPAERFRLWKEKVWVLSGLVAALTVLWLAQFGVLRWLAPGQPGVDLSVVELSELDLTAGGVLAAALLLVAVVCSSCYWTLVARSTLGGLVLSFAIPFLLLAILVNVLEWASPAVSGSESMDSHLLVACALFAPIYSLVFLWLGWRKFERLELRDALFPDNGTSPGWRFGAGSWVGRLLRCRPTGGGWNLVRKEFRLQKPLWMVAAAFTVGWLALAGLHWLQPQRGYQTVLAVVVCFYFPLTVLLAASISLGEEKNLGVVDWQLTLPVSALRQWAVKLGVGLVVALVLAVVLPLVLAWATLPQDTLDLEKVDSGALVAFSVMFCVVFFLSFWAAALLRNTIQAALAAVVGAAAMAFCVPSAVWLADQLGGLQTGMLTWFIVHFQLPLEVFKQDVFVRSIPCVAGTGLLVVVLAQSLTQFRRSQCGWAVIVRYSAVLLMTAFLGVFWCADFFVSAAHMNLINGGSVGFIQDIGAAVRAYARGGPPGNTPRQVTLRDLETKRALSPEARTWLKGAVISMDWPSTFERSDRQPKVLCATVELPSGKKTWFWYGTLQNGTLSSFQ